jgi:hypothetical protein
MYQEAEEEGEVLKLIANKRAPGRTEPTNGRFCVPPMYRGDGSEVSLIEKRELGSIAREFQNRVEGEVGTAEASVSGTVKRVQRAHGLGSAS